MKTTDRQADDLVIGLDIGSTYAKGALLDGKGNILSLNHVRTGWAMAEAAEKLLAGYRAKGSDIPVVATGYGRFLAPGRTDVLTEISAHALGAEKLRPGVATVIDVGGQDTKVTTVSRGRPVEFLMNDKCAAGTGRFLEMALQRLEVDLEDLEAAKDLEAANLTSVCAVFAETEMMGLLAAGRPRLEIALGAVAALADKAAALASRLHPAAPVVLTGGLSRSSVLARRLGEALSLTAEPAPHGFYAGAIGAAWSHLIKRKELKTTAE